MLAKINSNYCGYYGHFYDDKNIVEIKTRESAPFEIDDALFDRLSRKGVLVAAGKEAPAAPEYVPESTVMETDDDVNLNSLSLKELKEMAKEYGVPYRVGMKKSSLIEAIKSAQTEEPPMLTVEEPE